MATSRTFNAMLNDHLNYDLLREEFIKRDYILQKIEKDNDWKGGDLPVPFEGAPASSVAFGGLTASSDIAEAVLVRGSITTQPEVWGSLIFNHRDIIEHDGKVNEQSFLKLLPGQLDGFMDYMKMVVSLSITNGKHFATATANGDASGNLPVDRPERFVLNQKCSIDDGDSAPVTGYVKTIDMDTGVVNFVTARGGAVAVDLSTYTTAQTAKVYFEGSQSNGLTSLKESLLSATNGGSATLYGQTKTVYPYLQSINVSGAALNATTLLAGLFDAFTTIKNRGKGKPDTVLMSYKHMGSIMKKLEDTKGAYHVAPNSTKVDAYGWTEIQVFGVKGVLTLVAIQEMDDDWIPFIDWRAIKFHSNGFFRKRKSPNGDEFHEVRNTTGYQFIVDMCLFGDLVVNRPSYCGVLYGLSY